MAKSNHILALADAALSGDRARIEAACKCISSNEKDSSSLKVQIDKLLGRSKRLYSTDSELVPAEIRNFVLHVEPEKTLCDIALQENINKIVNDFIKERSSVDTLLKYNLVASNKLLLSGPPGNGKTSLAGAIASELNLPFLVLDFSTVVTSALGSTASNIAKVFRSISNQPCVFFVDEMETMLSERSGLKNKNDVGEIARIVSALLLEIDRLDNRVVLIGATNHIEMLDRAVVRRFNHNLVLSKPNKDM